MAQKEMENENNKLKLTGQSEFVQQSHGTCTQQQQQQKGQQQRSQLDSISMQDDYDDEFNWASGTSIHNISFSYSNSPMGMEADSTWTTSYSKDLEWQNSEHFEEQVLESDDGGGGCGFETSPLHVGNGDDEVVLEKEESDDYSKEFYEWNCILEEKYHPRESLKNQPQVQSGNRTTLIAWLSKVIRSQDLYPETLFLTVNLIDRFLVSTPIALECLQLLGLSALFIAAKQLEMYHPGLSELLKLGSDVFSKQHFLQMERIILKQLRFHLAVATSLFFVEYYISYPQSGRNVNILLQRPFRTMVRHLVELSIQDYNLSQFPPSCLALASMAVVEEYAKGHPIDLTKDRYSMWGYPPSHLKKCTTEIWLYLSRVLAGPISDLSNKTFFDNYCTLEKT